MAGKHQKDEITDEDIDNLFNNDDSSVVQVKKEDLVPKELSLENNKKTNHIDRPTEKQDSLKTKVKKEKKKEDNLLEKQIKENLLSVKEVNNFSQLRAYIKGILNYRSKEEKRQEATRSILSGCTETHTDPGTQCTFHIFQPKHIMGDSIYCSCKFCSAEKTFTQEEWNEYCIKYRKWF